MTTSRSIRRAIRPLLAATLLAGLLAGCASAPTDGAAPSGASTPASSSPPPSPAAAETPEQSFRNWLAASREPEVELACSYVSEELVTKMLAELAASGVALGGCAEMIATTAQLYAALGESADAEVETVSEAADRAELFVTYGSGDCGTVVLVPGGGRWILTEHSQEVC
ncbi:hypothetical protein [Agromyces soli]|uniref:Lipoprotein n=1 Tax=Agromyces soli TaxID=659012 RepID=A0ABY4AZ24_9MICO|nr:hypothetical protein [Agromyces soli]UOE26070.1 hypothetical protein MTP13_17440 [Agromyces soli]